MLSSIHKPKSLFHLNARGGVGFAIAEDIDLFVAEDFLRSSGVSRHVLHGGWRVRTAPQGWGLRWRATGRDYYVVGKYLLTT